MRSGLIALRAVGAATVLVLAPAAATAAYADDSVTVTVAPSSAAPGGKVELRVSGCKGTTGAVASQGFVVDAELSRRVGQNTLLFGNTMVKAGVKPGAYDVNVTCDGQGHSASGRVQVVQHQPAQQPTNQATPQSTQQPTNQPSQQPTPVAPVRAGGGGAAAQLAARDASVNRQNAGPGVPHTVIGLVLAGVAAVAVASRTSRRRRTDAD
ncbi:PT domain-containing protein [Streptomyces sp. NPDC060064]|uniref:PT domain-containing protein n=1 Tax=Streptomyces sp. NPDC060064 TaxID=3347049 RepID=UPI0036A1A8D7